MIEGVEILNTYQQVLKAPWTWTIWGTISLIVGIGCFILAMSYALDNDDGFQAFFGFFGIVFILCGIALNFTKNPIYQDVYEVTITDEVSITDFYEHYEIIDQNGLIFTVRERK